MILVRLHIVWVGSGLRQLIIPISILYSVVLIFCG
jgi:hypothetical protein